jgi:hypothetical protein
MNYVEGFVHLYHIWGALGFITAAMFGIEAHRSWRLAGGTWREAPYEWAYAGTHVARETFRDIGRLIKWTVGSFFGMPFTWESGEWQGRKYPRRQTILIGITLGGTSRFLTALYWAEKNRDWMTSADNSVIFIASFVILPAIIGDLHHHATAWPNKPHRVRLLALVCAIYVCIGLVI